MESSKLHCIQPGQPIRPTAIEKFAMNQEICNVGELVDEKIKCDNGVNRHFLHFKRISCDFECEI